MGSLTAYCETTNGANTSQSNVTREKSSNMMLACRWIKPGGGGINNKKLKWESEVDRRIPYC
jgi:hypothetical protein